MRLEYQDFPISKVIEYFTEGFTFPEGEKLYKIEWFYDPHKATVILRLFVHEKDDDKPVA